MQIVRWIAVAVLTLTTLSSAEAQEMLSNLQIVGTITRTGKAPPFQVGDTIKVIEDKGEALAATGSVLDPNGTFYVEMSKSAKYNGTPVHLKIVVQGEELPLMDGKSEAKLAYQGGFPFPKRETKKYYYGDGTLTAASTCPKALPKCDVFGNGVFDQKVIDFVKAQIAAKNPDIRADLNGDGVVDSKDLIDGLREFGKLKSKH